MQPYMHERVRNWKWWAGVLGLGLEGAAGILRLKYGGTSNSLILLLLGVGLVFIWLTDRLGKSTPNNYKLPEK
jgi:hypothetical protein